MEKLVDKEENKAAEKELNRQSRTGTREAKVEYILNEPEESDKEVDKKRRNG